MIAVHAGRILKRELSAIRLAIELKLPSGRTTDVLNGKWHFSRNRPTFGAIF
jgi:hypothetical protein